MAVKNEFVTQNASAVAVDKDIAARSMGSIKRAVAFSFEVEAADDNASVYRIAKLPVTAIVTSVQLKSDAIAGFTNPSIGIYKSLDVGGAVISADCLMAATDLNAGLAVFTEKFAPAAEKVGMDILSLAGVADASKDQYGTVDVAITTAAGVSAAGTVSGIIEYTEGV